MTEVTRMRWPVFQLINVILRILAIVYVLMETKNRPPSPSQKAAVLTLRPARRLPCEYVVLKR